MTRRSIWSMAVLCAAMFVPVLVTSPPAGAGEGDTHGFPSPFVDDSGAISLPQDYRAKWVSLGTFMVPDEDDPAPGFHDVFTQPSAVAVYKKEGKFPDGTVLVKEIRKTEGAKMTTGQANWAGDIVQWFVMVKDATDRFPENPIWGEGWGWALFKPADPTKNTATDYKLDCIGCHIPAKANDWLYVEGYPTLR